MKVLTGKTACLLVLAMTILIGLREAGATPPVCGDGRLHPAVEQCDDGNTLDGDGCSSRCMVEGGVCGNGIREKGEACDDGNTTASDGCSPTCLLEATPPELVIITESSAPLMVVEPSYTYEAVTDMRYEAQPIKTEPKYEINYEAQTVHQLAYCGDGITQANLGEQCDDGNKVDDDFCDSTCRTRFVPIRPNYFRSLKIP